MSMDRSVLDHLEIGLVILAAAGFLIYFIVVNYRSNKRNNAPVETARAIVHYKHPDMEPVLLGRHSCYIYYVTFHTETGEALTLYMNRDAYFNIPEGASGELLYQGEKLWRFTLEDGTEIKQ